MGKTTYIVMMPMMPSTNILKFMVRGLSSRLGPFLKVCLVFEDLLLYFHINSSKTMVMIFMKPFTNIVKFMVPESGYRS